MCFIGSNDNIHVNDATYLNINIEFHYHSVQPNCLLGVNYLANFEGLRNENVTYLFHTTSQTTEHG